MGSAVGRLGTRKPAARPPAARSISLESRGGDDDDVPSSVASGSGLSLNSSVPTGRRGSRGPPDFDWSRVQTIYLGCPSALSADLSLTGPMVRVVEAVFARLERDFVANARKVHLCCGYLGEGFGERFRACAETERTDFRFGSHDDRFLAHVIGYLKFQRMLLYLFGNVRGVSEARKCLNLLAFGHRAMGVTQSDFRMFDIAVEKFLMKFGALDEHELRVVVAYLNLVTNYVCNRLQWYTESSSFTKLIAIDDADSKRREEAKQYRKWEKLRAKLRYDTCPYIEEALGEMSERQTKMCPLSSISRMFNDNNNKQ